MHAIVVQLGFAMIPFGVFMRSSGLTSLTTRGTSGSRRQADELSTTMAPAAAAFGASSSEAVLPLENTAMSMPLRSATDPSSTTTSPSAHGSVVPADRADAKKRTSSSGKRRCCSSVRMTLPTWPVAPKTPTRMPQG